MPGRGHRYAGIILDYYRGCNTADHGLLMSTLADSGVHYFVDHSPVETASGLANYWVKVGPRTKATWHLDHIIVQEAEAVIEWSMQWTPAATGEVEVLRGTEWYRFDSTDRITEIRSYHNNFFLHAPENRALHGFDYAGRGYYQGEDTA